MRVLGWFFYGPNVWRVGFWPLKQQCLIWKHTFLQVLLCSDEGISGWTKVLGTWCVFFEQLVHAYAGAA